VSGWLVPPDTREQEKEKPMNTTDIQTALETAIAMLADKKNAKAVQADLQRLLRDLTKEAK
jgi:FixJ family two-component response regulator